MAKTRELLPVKKYTYNLVDRFHGRFLLQNEDGTFYHETYIPETVPYSEGDTYHQVTSGEEGRLDLISYKYYNTPLLDWAIMLANPEISHPIKDVVAGITLRIPTSEFIYSELIRS